MSIDMNMYWLDMQDESDRLALRWGVFAALLTTLMMIWVPLPAPNPRTKRVQTKPTVLRPIPLVKLATEKAEQLRLKPHQSTTPVPWKVDQLKPEVLVEEERFENEAAYDATTWELDLNVEEPVSNKIFQVSTPGLVEPVFTRRVAPDYPRRALTLGLQGYVILEAVLTKDGDIVDVHCLRSLGNQRFGFEQAAEDALKNWEFKPGTLNGHPVNVRFTLRIDFKLPG